MLLLTVFILFAYCEASNAYGTGSLRRQQDNSVSPSAYTQPQNWQPSGGIAQHTNKLPIHQAARGWHQEPQHKEYSNFGLENTFSSQSGLNEQDGGQNPSVPFQHPTPSIGQGRAAEYHGNAAFNNHGDQQHQHAFGYHSNGVSPHQAPQQFSNYGREHQPSGYQPHAPHFGDQQHPAFVNHPTDSGRYHQHHQASSLHTTAFHSNAFSQQRPAPNFGIQGQHSSSELNFGSHNRRDVGLHLATGGYGPDAINRQDNDHDYDYDD